MSEIKVGGHCPKCQQPLALCYCGTKFDFGQLLEDHCSVMIKKKDFVKLKEECERLRYENEKLRAENETLKKAVHSPQRECYRCESSEDDALSSQHNAYKWHLSDLESQNAKLKSLVDSAKSIIEFHHLPNRSKWREDWLKDAGEILKESEEVNV